MKKIIVVILFFLVFSCDSPQPTLPKKKLQGIFNGQTWNLIGANAYLASTDSKYRIQFMSNKESFSKPCEIAYPAKPHLRMVLFPKEGSYSLPLPNFQESIKFVYPNGKELIATSGYLEIFLVERQRILGYLKAELDDKHKIEGSFEVNFCD